MGLVWLNIATGPVEKRTKFHVMDIKTPFNLLLGRPWLHELGAVASTYHQKVKFLLHGTPVVIDASPMKIQAIDKSTLQVQHDNEEEELWGFSASMIEESSYDANLTIHTILRKQGYFPGMPLGSNKKYPILLFDLPQKNDKFGLGYLPTKEEIREQALKYASLKKNELNNEPLLPPYELTLNGRFVRDEERFPSFGFPEPFLTLDGKRYPGLEIFQDCDFIEDRVNNPVKNTSPVIDGMGMGVLLGMEKEENTDNQQVMSSGSFDQIKLITPTSNVVKGWRKTLKITTPDGRKFRFVVGEGQMYDEHESEKESESESSLKPRGSNVSKVKDSLRFPIESKNALSASPEASVFDAMISEYNKTMPFAYSFPSLDCFNSETIENEQNDNELINAMEEHEQRNPVIEDTEEVDISNNGEPQMVRIGLSLSVVERTQLIETLKEYRDVFAWSYKDMPGIDPEIAEHTIPLVLGAKPVKQKLRRMKPDIALKIEEEVVKQLEAGFIKTVHYPEWIANVVPVMKKNGKVRMCVDFCDLNKASPKDDYPLPHIDILVDNTANHALLSFMDGYAGYNQVKMAEKDMEKTTFITPWGIFCYTVIPFGLKNAGATYQRAATTLLHDMMHKEVEVYVDDMIVKAKEREDHDAVLRKFFERLRKYKVRLNPKKCAFAVTSGKLLGYVISSRGIEIDPSKIQAIMSLKPPANEKEIRGFLGRLQYISRFISKLTMVCEPIFRKLKKNEPTVWDDDCQQAFDKVKGYLSNPPVLLPPVPDLLLRLNLTVTQTAAGAMLAQEVEGKENAIYYLSKKFLEYETRYSSTEKLCLALVWATKKLRHYLLTHTVHIVSKADPLKYLLEKPAMNGRLSRWVVILSEFDLKYVSQKAIKGSIVPEFLATSPGEAEPEDFEFPDEDLLMTEDGAWSLYFDGSSNQKGCGVGILLVSPEEEHTPISVKLDFYVTNNAAEYEACIILEAAVALGVEKLRVYGDSSLIINQISGKWKVRSESLAPYQAHLETIAQNIKEVKYTYLCREDNHFADALARLASMIRIPSSLTHMPLVIERRQAPAHINAIDDETQNPSPTEEDRP